MPGSEAYEEIADALRNNEEPVEYITISAAARAARDWFEENMGLDWRPFPEQKPVAEPADSRFSLPVLVNTGEGYAVAYYNYNTGDWTADDTAMSVQTLIFVFNVRRWAYLPERTPQP